NAEELTLSSYVKLLRAAESISARAHRHLTQEKLSFSQFGVLEALYHLGPLVQRDLATKLLKSARNITMVVDNLEKRGLVRRVRSETDRRFTHIHMTPEGRLLFEQVFPRHVAGILREMRVLSVRELEALGEFCRRLGRQPERGDP
ncbi:MAG TPA: MarR family transcriptional regulator, partial [Deferrisomatales bacterium]|nr:MarR family transcriptional regulator [Deferrisomatales bacterium]